MSVALPKAYPFLHTTPVTLVGRKVEMSDATNFLLRIPFPSLRGQT